MDRERKYDPYSKDADDELPLNFSARDVVRFGVGGIGAILLLVGVVFGIQAFNAILSVIKEPQTVVAFLDTWTSDDAAQANEQTETAADPASTDTTAPADGTSEALPAEEELAPEEATEEPPPLDFGEITLNNEPAPSYGVDDNGDFDEVWDDIMSLLRDARMGKIAGAAFLFLCLWLLVKIPFGFIKTGGSLLLSAADIKNRAEL